MLGLAKVESSQVHNENGQGKDISHFYVVEPVNAK
jgi:hypothetical protein